MVRPFVIAIACVWSVGLSVPGVQADPPFRFPEAKCPHGELKYINDVPVLMVDGTPDEIGSAVGLLALKPGQRMAHYPVDVLREYCLTALRWPLLYMGRLMVQQFPQDYREELHAMAAAGEVDPDLAVLGNTMFDLKKVVACSALLVDPDRSATGGSLLGRNLDYPALGYAQEYTLVTVYRPAAARHFFATVGFPGLIGCLSGMNDAGLAVAVLEVLQGPVTEKRFDPSGTPYALCYRRLLEECSTIDEARDLLTRMKRTGLSNLVVADRDGVAVFEITPERVVVRRPERGTCACTNHFCSDELKSRVTFNLFATCDRFMALTKVGELQRPLGPSDLQVGLHEACLKTLTLQTMVFESQPLRLHLASGSIPASAGAMKVVELAPLLRQPSQARRADGP
jgi:isopenicillin-N N-acyltransferase like protein